MGHVDTTDNDASKTKPRPEQPCNIFFNTAIKTTGAAPVVFLATYYVSLRIRPLSANVAILSDAMDRLALATQLLGASGVVAGGILINNTADIRKGIKIAQDIFDDLEGTMNSMRDDDDENAKEAKHAGDAARTAPSASATRRAGSSGPVKDKGKKAKTRTVSKISGVSIASSSNEVMRTMIFVLRCM